MNPFAPHNAGDSSPPGIAAKAFVLTLERAVQRRAHVEELCRLCPIPCELLSAVDGSSLSEARRHELAGEPIYRPRYPFRLRDGEIGVFMSHRKAWREIVFQNLDAGLVFEDDAELDLAVFRSGFELALSELKPLDVIRFPVQKRYQVAEHHDTPPLIHAPIVTPLVTVAQLVGNEAARRLLELTERFDRPIDTFLQMSWVTGIRPRVVTPSGVTEISARLGGTTIHAKKRPWTETLSRNLLRPIYRLQVRVYSRLRGPRRGAAERPATVERERKPCS